MNKIQQVVSAHIEKSMERVKMPFIKMALLGVLSGMSIAGGAAASNVVMHGISNVGLARLAGGAVFPVGLMIIVFLGGELFTGDCLMILGVLDRKIRSAAMLRVLALVYVANLVGSVLFALLVSTSGQYDYSNSLLGAYTVKVALTKAGLSSGSGFVSGILCNIFVCAAVMMTGAAKSAAGKLWSAFFPIMAFVVSGYEHCVANMYYIPAGIFALGNGNYVQAAIEQYGVTTQQLAVLNWQNFVFRNLLPVTIGNVVGGVLFVGALLYFAHRER